jgi:hypothetical protein
MRILPPTLLRGSIVQIAGSHTVIPLVNQVLKKKSTGRWKQKSSVEIARSAGLVEIQITPAVAEVAVGVLYYMYVIN